MFFVLHKHMIVQCKCHRAFSLSIVKMNVESLLRDSNPNLLIQRILQSESFSQRNPCFTSNLYLASVLFWLPSSVTLVIFELLSNL